MKETRSNKRTFSQAKTMFIYHPELDVTERVPVTSGKVMIAKSGWTEGVDPDLPAEAEAEPEASKPKATKPSAKKEGKK